MWLVLQPILVIGMLCNDKLFVAAVMAALAARFTSRLHSELDPVFRRRTASQIKSHNRNSPHSSDRLVGAGEQSGWSSLQAVAAGYETKINLSDECRPLCISRGQLMSCLFRGAVARARRYDSAQHRCNRYRHNRRIKLKRAHQHGYENGPTSDHQDPAG